MIIRIGTTSPFSAFIKELKAKPSACAPLPDHPEDYESHIEEWLKKPDHCAFAVFSEERLTGIFVFLVIESERYLELLSGLSKSVDAYEEMLQYLEENHAGWHADFVMNPANQFLSSALRRRNADFDTEQQKMRLTHLPPDTDMAGVQLLSDQWKEQYTAMHSRDVYWIGERILEAPDRFNVLIAIENNTVIGYLDITKGHNENDIFGLKVKKGHRRKGYGRKLLAKAIELNKPKGMILEVNVDNEPAISLYQSMGFEVIPGRNTITVGWDIGK